MFSLVSITSSMYEKKGSKFLAFLIPYANFCESLEKIRKEHPKACHFVTAFRCLEHSINEGCSDDGEPKGSAGVPILKVLRGEQIINVGIVVVRYFGGTLLGVGGLVRAYTQAAQAVIAEAKQTNTLTKYCETISWSIDVDYALLNKVVYICKKISIEIEKKDFFSDCVSIKLRSSNENKQKFFEDFYGCR